MVAVVVAVRLQSHGHCGNRRGNGYWTGSPEINVEIGNRSRSLNGGDSHNAHFQLSNGVRCST